MTTLQRGAAVAAAPTPFQVAWRAILTDLPKAPMTPDGHRDWHFPDAARGAYRPEGKLLAMIHRVTRSNHCPPKETMLRLVDALRAEIEAEYADHSDDPLPPIGELMRQEQEHDSALDRAQIAALTQPSRTAHEQLVAAVDRYIPVLRRLRTRAAHELHARPRLELVP